MRPLRVVARRAQRTALTPAAVWDPDTGRLVRRRVPRPVYAPSAGAERLRHERLGQGCSLVRAAERLGLTASELAQLEEGFLDLEETEWTRLWARWARKGGLAHER